MTVLAADTSTVFGAQSAWRQLVDLVGRDRADDAEAAIARLAELRAHVPRKVRAASARAVATDRPPAALVRFFAQDDSDIAAPVLRAAQLDAADWLSILPLLSPANRGVLRHRRDLPAEVVRGLGSFGGADFVLGHGGGEPGAAPAEILEQTVAAPVAPLDTTPFIAIGEAARAIPVVAEALKQAAESAPRFEIADLVARIDAYQRRREAEPAARPLPTPAAPADRFRFATDAAGIIRWIDGTARGPLVGVSLAMAGRQGAASLDASAGGALRKRSAFRDARLEIGGASDAAGEWRLFGEPVFEAATGRFAGMSGVARRPRPEERAASGDSVSDQVRQLVHELRTPAGAISGFAELIASELKGPVLPVYRERAALIQRQAAELVGAIEDLDTAARLEGGALELRPGVVDLADLVRQAASELAPLASQRGAGLSLELEPAPVVADDRAAQRLVTRLLATLLAAAQPGEPIRVRVTERTRNARLTVTRPRALAIANGDALLTIDADAAGEGGPLLGTGFALRLARNLAVELGGRLVIEEDRLTLRLPLAQSTEVEQATAQ